MKEHERVIVYGSMGIRRGISDLLWAYRKANKMEEFPAYLDDHPFQVMDRIRSESKLGLKTADVVLMPHYAVESLGFDGFLARYDPNKIEESPANMRAGKGGSIPVGVTFMAMAYKTGSVGDLPKNLSALSEKSWSGRLGSQSITASKAGNLGAQYLSFLGTRLKGSEWQLLLRSLGGANRPKTYDCIDHLLQGLMEDDIRLALTVYSLAFFREKTSGSPVSLLGDEVAPHMMTFTSAGLTKAGEGSESAKKFIDFLLTPEGQSIIGNVPGIAPVREGTKMTYDFQHSYDGNTEFHPV